MEMAGWLAREELCAGDTTIGDEHGKAEKGPVHGSDRRPCRSAHPRAPHHAGTDPTTARRDDRRYLPTGTQIRTRDQSRFGWPALRDRPRPQRADYLFLRGVGTGSAAPGHAAPTHAA